MRVLNVNMSLDAVEGGGTAERTFQMSRYLAKSGVECAVVTTDLGLTGERVNKLKDVQIIALPCINKRFYIPKFSYRSIKKVIANVDIIHLMGHWTLINVLVYFIVRALGKPYVVCPAGALSIYGRSKIIKTLYNWVVGRHIIRNASGCIAITADEISQFQKYGVPPDRVSIIPNGIDGEYYRSRDDEGFRRRYGLGNDPFILFVGRLNPIKGPDLLLEAFCHLKDRLERYHIAFAGPDEGMLPKLKEMVANHRVENRVHFIGYIGGDEKSQAYHAADLLVIPSRQEAMSIVVLEAGISGTPVLLTNRCGFNEVSDTGGGQVVSASVEGVKEGLLEILKDKTQLKRKGKKLNKYIRENFLWDVIINQYSELYKNILYTELHRD